MRISFDINEAVFNARGTYLEEKAVHYEEILIGSMTEKPYSCRGGQIMV
ncbi:hypothetical protein [Dictyobacter formicarum]|uniref:Uncharacterized protein n=1 Tax=Dictyobacter formicarum TaxID=2778368 RepID=A0ABQ3VB22_9CHLR|nr:hypothetical protein [Dictyobacter formicarum]GHO82676.1 hypothetical protein KSZ_06820 [Dictyobacter formicarum]